MLHYRMVEMERIELSISGCKPDVFPLALHPHNVLCSEPWNRTRLNGLTVRRLHRVCLLGT